MTPCHLDSFKDCFSAKKKNVLRLHFDSKWKITTLLNFKMVSTLSSDQRESKKKEIVIINDRNVDGHMFSFNG